MLDLRFGLSCPDVYLGHVKNLSREEMCLVTSFTSVSVCFQLPSVLFLPRLVLCRGEGSSHLSLCARGAPASPWLRARGARAGACLDTSEHSPGVPRCPSAPSPIHVLPCTPASPWLSHLCPIPCSASRPGELLVTAPGRAPFPLVVLYSQTSRVRVVILSVLPSWALFSREPSCEICKP